MVDKIIFTVTPIFSIPPRCAAAVETWIYQVAKMTRIPNRIVCIKEEGYSDITTVSERCSIHRIGFSRIYKRIFQKLTRIDPLPYSQRILNVANDFNITDNSVIVVHNSMKLYRQIRERSPHAKIVMHMHNAYEPKGMDDNVKMLVPSNYLKDYYQGFLPDADIAIVPNGTDPYNTDKHHVKINSSELNISPEKKIVFYAGRISPEKGLMLLLQAFELLIRTRDDIEQVVIGDYASKSKGEKGIYQKKIRELAKQLGSHCHMLGGVAPEEMHRYYSLADLVVIPSQFQEPFCMVAIEAMSAGKPVLVSTRGGMIEFVKDKDTGYHLQEPMTPETIAVDIEKTLNNPDLLSIAHHGKQFVLENYLWWQVTHKFETVISNWFDCSN